MTPFFIFLFFIFLLFTTLDEFFTVNDTFQRLFTADEQRTPSNVIVENLIIHVVCIKSRSCRRLLLLGKLDKSLYSKDFVKF